MLGPPGVFAKGWRSDKEAEKRVLTNYRRLRYSPAISILSAGSLDLKLLEMYTARRLACRMEVLETLEAFGKGGSRD